MDQQNNEYLLQLQKLMSSQIATTFWAPTMDILAIVTFDNLLQGYRISFKAQRFFQIQQSQSIQTLCFSPDSKLIAYSLLDGSVKLIRSQNGQRVITVENLGSGDIENLNFVPFAIVNPQEFMPFCKNSIQNKLILNISPHKNCNKNAIIKINYFNQLKQDFTCLLLSQRTRVWLLLNGFMPIACMDYAPVLANTTSNRFRILYSHLDDKIYSIIAEQVQSTYVLSLLTFQADPISQIKSDVVKYNCLISNITQILNFTQTTYTALQTCLRDIIRQYNSKINLIDDSSSPDIVPREELLQYLSIGLTSSSLINFFTKEIYDTKVLQKLDQTLTSLFTNLHDIIIESVQNGLEKATLFLLKLISYSQVPKYDLFGIRTKQLKQIQQKIIRLYTLGQMLLVESTEIKFNIRNLLIWLNKASIKSVPDNQAEIQNSKSYLNKYTVDYTRLYKFLSNQDTFRLQSLLRFFRKTEDKEPMVIPQADFNLLGQPRGDGTFYKNNPTQEQIDLFHYLQKQLEIDNVHVHKQSQMEAQLSYYSFRVQTKYLLAQWKSIASRPYENIGTKLCGYHHKHSIGKVTLTQLFPFQPKFLFNPKDNYLYLFYIDRQQEYDRIIRYNCTTQTKYFVYTSKYTILSISVAEDIIGVFEQKMGQRKIIAQVSNQKFDGGQIQFGRVMSNCDQTQLSINSSSRGLNSLVVDKTKLVIFD